MREALHGITFLLVLLLAATIEAIFLLFPAVFLLFIPLPQTRDMYRYISNLMSEMWFSLATVMIEYYSGTKLEFYGDLPKENEHALIISNHHTRIDWMYVWCLCARTRRLSTFRIVLKESLKAVPIVGWLMQSLLYIFLSRKNRDKDIQHINNVISYLASVGQMPTLLLFPEGTDLAPQNLEKSKAYSEGKGLQHYQNVLHPKTKGFYHALNCMRGEIDAVYDLTMAYKYYKPGERPSELAFVTGRFPKEVHILIKRIPIQEMPEEYDGVEKFVKESFALKEWQLEEALYNGTSSQQEKAKKEQGTEGEEKKDREVSSLISFSPSYRHVTEEVSASMNAFAMYWTAVWIVIINVVLFSLFWFSWVKWYAAIALIGLTLITRVVSKGLDDLELKLHSHQDMNKGKDESNEQKESESESRRKDEVKKQETKKEETLRKRA